MFSKNFNALIGAKISKFRKKMADVRETIRKTPSKIYVDVEARVNKFHSTINRVSNAMQALDTIGRNAGSGMLMATSPAAIPILASMIGLLGVIGPMIGVVAGSTFALATAFGFAGAAAIAFAGIAAPTISALFGDTKKLTKEQKKARKEFDKVGGTWKGIVKELEKPVLQAFTKAMQATNKMLQMAKPLFAGATTAVNNLMSSLNNSLDSPPVKAFFDYMNKKGGPMLEKMGKGLGFFMQGIMNMMVAFGPLAEHTANGFLNMGKGFSEWAAGLKNNKGFNDFINYIVANMPKIKSIVGDAIGGITGLFTAFGPAASDMLTWLQDSMGKFKEWGTTLKDNPAFQNFIGYIKENAPKVIELIKNIGKFVTNLGVSLAPLGSAVLDIINKVLSWTNTMMENHPWIGKLIGIVAIFAGGLIALTPVIIAAKTLFSGLGGAVLKLGAKFLLAAGRMALSWIIAMGPVGWVIAGIIALVALIIWKWDEIKAWTKKTWNAIWGWIKDTAKKIWDKIKSTFSDIKDYLSGIDLKQIGKDIIQGLINGIKSMGSSLISKVTGVVDGAIGAAKKLLGIASPSKVFKQFGVFTGEGFAIGMNKTTSLIKRQSMKMSDAALFEPQRDFAFRPSINRRDFGALDSNSNTDSSNQGANRQISVVVNGNGVTIDENRLISLLQREEALHG